MNTEDKNKIYLKEFYTLAQVGDELNLNIQTLRLYVKEGYEGYKLNAYKVGHTYYTTREDIKEFLQHFKVDE